MVNGHINDRFGSHWTQTVARQRPATSARQTNWRNNMMHATRKEHYVLPQLKYDYGGFEPRNSGRIMDLHDSSHRHASSRMGRCALIVLAFGLSIAASVHAASEGDWPSYNRSLQGDRFAPQTEITPINAANLRQICSYSLDHPASFQTFASRPNDHVGIGFARTDFNPRAAQAISLAHPGAVTPHAEYCSEIYYSYLLLPWLTVRPDVQYIANPGGYSNARGVIVVGARMVVAI
jgi:hypothetical protein